MGDDPISLASCDSEWQPDPSFLTGENWLDLTVRAAVS